MAARTEVLVPVLAVALSAAVWGLWWIPVRALAGSGFAGDWVSLALYGLGVVAMLPLLPARRARFAGGGRNLVLIGLSFGVTLTLWNHALLTGEVVRMVLLFYLCPVWATGFAWIMLGQRVSIMRLIAIGLGLTGAAVVLGFEGGVPLPRTEGEWMAIAAGVLFALGATITRRAENCADFEKVFVSFAVAALTAFILVTVAPIGEPPAPADLPRALPLLVGVTVLWLLPQSWLLIWGAKRLDPGLVSLLLLLEIVAAAVSAALFAGEPFGPRELAGCLLILSAGAVEAVDQHRLAAARMQASPAD